MPPCRASLPVSSRRVSIPRDLVAASLDQTGRLRSNRGMPAEKISVFLADDNLIVREGVRALIGTAADMEVVGVAGDYQGLVAGAEDAAPQVIVTDIRMPPSFQREGIDAAKQVRKRHPGTGIVVLSQYDEPDYAISLLSEGAAGDRKSTRLNSSHLVI